MPDKPDNDDKGREEESEDCNVEGKGLVDSVTGQSIETDAGDLLRDKALQEKLRLLKRS